MRKLKDKVHRCQKVLDDLPGADLSRERQERLRNEDKEILENKKFVVLKLIVFKWCEIVDLNFFFLLMFNLGKGVKDI